MLETLKPLLAAARKIVMSPRQQEEQRQSFAYGNTAIENDRITRKMIRTQAERLAAQEDDGGEQEQPAS